MTTKHHRAWLEVDREGLRQILARRGKSFAVLELLQNALDEPGVTTVTIRLVPHSLGTAELVVTDDAPEGFQDLRHAWTLFAPSKKKPNPELRGRFNLGEKLVLALCREASITTTTGSVRFDAKGRSRGRSRREAGTEFRALVRLSRKEIAETLETLEKVIPPSGVRVIVERQAGNPRPLWPRHPVGRFAASLPTEIEVDGELRRSRRKTMVSVYQPKDDETGTLYEMGIPVVATGDTLHYDVAQRVPLSLERDNVTPAYLRELRVAVANALPDFITEENANDPWVRDAVSDPRAEPETIRAAVEARFGTQVVAYDPSDAEANSLAVSKGYTVVHGSQLSKAEWKNLRKVEGLVPPAGKVTPSHSEVWSGPNGVAPKPEESLSTGERAVCDYARRLASELIPEQLVEPITVQVYVMPLGFPKAAWYGAGVLGLNLTVLGRGFFDEPDPEAVDRLLLHEFAHGAGGNNHLDHRYHKELCRLGARLRLCQTLLYTPNRQTLAGEAG